MELNRIFDVLSNEVRIKIYKFLLEGKMCVSGMVSRLNVTQPTVTQHLKILQNAGMIKSKKIGYWMHYSIDESGLEKIKKTLGDFIHLLNVNETKCRIPSSKCPEKNK